MLRKGYGAKTDDAVTAEEEIKDPFVLEFLDLKDEYSESDLEAEVVVERWLAWAREVGAMKRSWLARPAAKVLQM